MTSPSRADAGLREALARYVIGPRNPVPETSRLTLRELQDIRWSRHASDAERSEAEWIARAFVAGPLAAEQARHRAEVATLEDRLTTETARADAVTRERDKLAADLRAAVLELGVQVRARGEAEGKLRASEMAGVVEGWRDRALKAERERDEAEDACARMVRLSEMGFEDSLKEPEEDGNYSSYCRAKVIADRKAARGSGQVVTPSRQREPF